MKKKLLLILVFSLIILQGKRKNNDIIETINIEFNSKYDI